MNRIVTGLLPNKKYRFRVFAKTSRGLSIDENMVEVVTSSAESKFLIVFWSLNINITLFNKKNHQRQISK
jgi:hypothetical protein